MYSVEKTVYGLKLTFGGFIIAVEMQKWYDDLAASTKNASSGFGVVVDMRTLKPLPPEAQAILMKGQQLCKKAGMERSCVVLDNPTTTMQFRRLGRESGIDAVERYIDASKNTEWEPAAIRWVANGIDPDFSRFAGDREKSRLVHPLSARRAGDEVVARQ